MLQCCTSDACAVSQQRAQRPRAGVVSRIIDCCMARAALVLEFGASIYQCIDDFRFAIHVRGQVQRWQHAAPPAPRVELLWVHQ